MTPDQRARAMELFEENHHLVRSLVHRRASRRSWSGPFRDDVLQRASLRLWQLCQRAAAGERGCDRLLVKWIVGSGLHAECSQYRRDRERLGDRRVVSVHAMVDDDGRPWDLAAREPRLRVDGIHVSRADIRIDFRRELELLEHGLTIGDVAELMRITKQAVHKRAKRLGGVFIDGQWYFPEDRVRDAIDAKRVAEIEAARRREDKLSREMALSQREEAEEQYLRDGG